VSQSMQFLDQHAGVLALVGLLVAWLIYRFDRWSIRRGVLHGLEAELRVHGQWVGNAYGEGDRGRWPNPDYMVFKLVTVATDDAIARGPGLFLNRDLPIALVNYRQVVGHVNQLIDKQMDFQSNPELYGPNPPARLVAAAVQMTESIHIQGIGDATLQHRPAAFLFYAQVMDRLSREGDSKVLPLIWLATGLNLWFLKRVGWRIRRAMLERLRRPQERGVARTPAPGGP
jgi:hypothetical protein